MSAQTAPAKKMGRPKGKESRNKRAMRQLLQLRYPDYEPVLKMAEAAMEVTALAVESKEAGANDVDLWMQVIEAHNKVAKYVTPQLAAIKVEADVRHSDGGVLMVPESPLSIADWANQARAVQKEQEATIIDYQMDT